VISRALERPFSALAELGRRSPTQLLAELQRAGPSNVGFNAASGCVEDLVAAGVVDPAKMIREALEISYSYAKLILKTDLWSLGEAAHGPTSEEPPF
jgi:chaperonin GroEL